jgi:hypothetical protein
LQYDSEKVFVYRLLHSCSYGSLTDASMTSFALLVQIIPARSFISARDDLQVKQQRICPSIFTDGLQMNLDNRREKWKDLLQNLEMSAL